MAAASEALQALKILEAAVSLVGDAPEGGKSVETDVGLAPTLSTSKNVNGKRRVTLRPVWVDPDDGPVGRRGRSCEEFNDPEHCDGWGVRKRFRAHHVSGSIFLWSLCKNSSSRGSKVGIEHIDSCVFLGLLL